MRVLSFVNQKGGCGKTTAAINLAGTLAARGQRVLLVDLDPQAHATLGLGCDGLDQVGLQHVLEGWSPPADVVVPVAAGMHLMSSSSRLAEFEEHSARMLRPESALRDALEQVADDFDFALLDCPARADGVLTANALGASTSVLLVVETGAFALQGALSALKLFEEIAERRELSFDLRVLGTLFDRRTNFARDLLVALQARFGPLMYDTVVRHSVRLREAAACGVPVHLYAPESGAADDFISLAGEVVAEQPLLGRTLQGRAPREDRDYLTPAPAARPPGAAAPLRPGVGTRLERGL
jgi:chromosome partitioning protein